MTIIVIGAFAVGTIFGGAELMLNDVVGNWRASSPAAIGMFVELLGVSRIRSKRNLRAAKKITSASLA